MVLAPFLLFVVFLGIVILANAIRVVREYERVVVFRLGRLVGERGPGLVLLIPLIDRMVKVGLRTVTMDVPPQDVITKDNVSVKVNAVVYFRVVDPQQAIVQVENYLYATSQIAQTTLRSILGQAELDELLSEREKLNLALQQIIDRQTEPWGIKVSTVEVKNVDLPQEMQRAMARQAEAERERRAKIINAEGEFQAAERLAEAAAVIAKEPTALQLRYLQTLTEIATENNSTTIFPLPMDFLKVVHDLDGEEVLVGGPGWAGAASGAGPARRPRLPPDGPRVLVSGARGLIGSALLPALRARGHETGVLTRRATGPGEVGWDPAAGVLEAARARGFRRGRAPGGRAHRGALDARRARRSSARAAWAGPGCWPSASRRSSGRRACSSRPRRSASTATAATRCSTRRARRARASCPRCAARGRRPPRRPPPAASASCTRAWGWCSTPRGGALARLLPLFRLGLGGPLGRRARVVELGGPRRCARRPRARAHATRASPGPSTWSPPAR